MLNNLKMNSIMKMLIKKSNIIAAGLILLLIHACVEPVDLVTADAKSGGLVDVLTSNVPYKLGATPSIAVDMVIPQGPEITSIEVYNSFVTVDGKASNSLLMTTIDVAGANANNDVEESLSVTYADLIEGLTVEGAPLPSDEQDLAIGDTWTLNYVSVMADDSREVLNNASTSIGVANQYAGTYQVVGYFTHPVATSSRAINRKKFLTPIDGVTCLTYAGDLDSFGTDYEMYVVVNPDNSVSIEETDNTVTEIFLTPGEDNKYDPVTKTITLNYYYNASAPRKISEVYTPL
jgi:hypothetical protein